MSFNLAELQGVMQEAVLKATGGAEALVARPPRGSRAQRLGVYQSAYGLRLTEFLVNDYGQLRTYLGETKFREMAKAYIIRHPSDQPNARWYSRHLPEFLKAAAPYRARPEIAEIAALERALNDAFDGPDVPITAMADLAAIAPDDFARARFELAPSTYRVEVRTNVTSIWACLKAEEMPPKAVQLDEVQQVLVWRQSSGARFRMLGPEESMAIGWVNEGLPFGTVCELIAAVDDPESAAMRAAGYLRGWIEGEIISRVLIDAAVAK